MSSGGFDFEHFLESERASVELALDRALNTLRPLLPSTISKPVDHGVRAGGKRLRPILCVAAHSAVSGIGPGHPVGPGVYDLAVSIEMIHCYSLMHDDLPCMDDAELRRGRPTPHTIYGASATVLAGAALIPASAMQAWRAAEALGLDVRRRRDIVGILSRAAGAGGMVGGQGLDLLGEGRVLARDELDRLHGMKTGALLTASLLIGGTAAGATSDLLRSLATYGDEIGLAFQIADDVLDATADVETLGKNPSDKALGKSTYVRLLGVERARREAWSRVAVALRTLTDAGIESRALTELARYAVGRDR